MPNILVIDNNENFYKTIIAKAIELGHEAMQAHTLTEGFRRAKMNDYDIILLSANLPDGNGMSTIGKLINLPSSPEVIVVSDSIDADEAEEAIRFGAWDYCNLSDNNNKEVITPLMKVLEYREQQKGENSESQPIPQFEAIVGKSPQLQMCLETVAQAAQSDATVLITGETGTGKELIASAIHEKSARADKNFVVVDCAALPETLVESTLFGHEKGAYTGADRAQKGLVRQADGGTLFLDEVGEMPLSIQKAFLRVLEEQRFRPVGSRTEVESDFRLVVATNKDLDEMVLRGEFRKDLLYRMRSFQIVLPALRDRKEDIELLVLHHLKELRAGYGFVEKKISSDFLELLYKYSWPGNVRELLNALERAVIAAGDNNLLVPKHLPTNIRISVARQSVEDHDEAGNHGFNNETVFPKLQELRDAAINEIEREYLSNLMVHTEGDTKLAGKISGLSRSRLYALLKKHRISPNGGF